MIRARTARQEKSNTNALFTLIRRNISELPPEDVCSLWIRTLIAEFRGTSIGRRKIHNLPVARARKALLEWSLEDALPMAAGRIRGYHFPPYGSQTIGIRVPTVLLKVVFPTLRSRSRRGKTPGTSSQSNTSNDRKHQSLFHCSLRRRGYLTGSIITTSL